MPTVGVTYTAVDVMFPGVAAAKKLSVIRHTTYTTQEHTQLKWLLCLRTCRTKQTDRSLAERHPAAHTVTQLAAGIHGGGEGWGSGP